MLSVFISSVKFIHFIISLVLCFALCHSFSLFKSSLFRFLFFACFLPFLYRHYLFLSVFPSVWGALFSSFFLPFLLCFVHSVFLPPCLALCPVTISFCMCALLDLFLFADPLLFSKLIFGFLPLIDFLTPHPHEIWRNPTWESLRGVVR